ncbi:MAG: hypothetical protein RLZZ543_1524 [Bacteroidota bacterium]|jgi:hypothetical protein
MAEIRIGAKVRLLNEVGEGVVTGFNKQGMALVMMTDGFEIPYFPKQLVPIGGMDSAATSHSESSVASVNATALKEALYLAFVLEGIQKDQPKVSLRLLNQRKEALLIALYSETEKVYTLEASGELSAGSSKTVMTVILPELLQRDRFFIQVQALVGNTKVLPASWAGYIKHQTPAMIEPATWPQQLVFSERALLIEVYPERSGNQSSVPNKDAQPKKMAVVSQDWLLKQGRDGNYEVDLHIEELLEDTAGMDNAEIIRHQLRHFEKCLDEAQRRPVKRFVAIHGVGKGRLRDEIRKLLKAANIEHYDAPLSKYGYGATEILIK